MIASPPSSAIKAVLEGAPGGRVGSIGVLVQDGDGSVVVARTTAGIIEAPTGIYTASLVAPAAPGQYTVVWDVDGARGTEQMIVLDAVSSLRIIDAFSDAFSDPSYTSFEIPNGPWPVGQVVTAYLDRPEPSGYEGEPRGPVAGTATVAVDSTLTFTALPRETAFIAAAQVGGTWRRIRFRTV